MRRLLVFALAAAALAVLLVGTVSTRTASATSGTNCADRFTGTPLAAPYHICGKVYGTGWFVNKVTFTIQAQNQASCGYVAVRGYSPSRNFAANSTIGCATPYNSTNKTFSGTLTLNWQYPTGGSTPDSLDIYWIPDPGSPSFGGPDGFSIIGPPPQCHCDVAA